MKIAQKDEFYLFPIQHHRHEALSMPDLSHCLKRGEMTRTTRAHRFFMRIQADMCLCQRREGRESPNETGNWGLRGRMREREIECMNDDSCLCDDPMLSIRWETDKKARPRFWIPSDCPDREERKQRDFFFFWFSYSGTRFIPIYSLLSRLLLAVTVTDEHHASRTFDHQLLKGRRD